MHWLPRAVGRKKAGTFKHAGIFLHDPVHRNLPTHLEYIPHLAREEEAEIGSGSPWCPPSRAREASGKSGQRVWRKSRPRTPRSESVRSPVVGAEESERERGTHKAIGRGYLLLADYDSQLIRRENQFVSPPKVKSCEKTAKGKRDRARRGRGRRQTDQTGV